MKAQAGLDLIMAYDITEHSLLGLGNTTSIWKRNIYEIILILLFISI